MAGIDKIYLTDYNEYKHLEQFCEKYDSEFFKKYKYYLSCGLYDITTDIFKDGKEHPISNFSTEADVFIIQHLSDTDFKDMPNVIARLKEQYSGDSNGFDLIRQHKSEYDFYQIDRSGCKVILVERSNNKTLRHIKREQWEQVWIDVYYDRTKEYNYKNSLWFDYFSKTIFHRHLGCKYYKHLDDGDGYYDQFLHNVSMRQVCRYITQVRLKRGFYINVFCRNYQRDSNGTILSITADANYLFKVV